MNPRLLYRIHKYVSSKYCYYPRDNGFREDEQLRFTFFSNRGYRITNILPLRGNLDERQLNMAYTASMLFEVDFQPRGYCDYFQPLELAYRNSGATSPTATSLPLLSI